MSAHPPQDTREDYRRSFNIIGVGWLVAGIALGVLNLPLSLLLKEQLHLSAYRLSLFMTIGGIPTYIKPLLGILADTVPLFGTYRRHYLLFGCVFSLLSFLALAIVPRHFNPLLVTYFILTIHLVLVSTVQGGLMVDVGKRHGATGRLTAQRVGINRSEGLFSGFVGAKLSKFNFLLPMSISATLYALLTLVYLFRFKEAHSTVVRREIPREARRQFGVMLHSKTLWSAAGLVALVIAAPGFGTALLFYQMDFLHFSKDFLGNIALTQGIFGIVGAILYSRWCKRYPLRQLLTYSIIVHAAGTLFYLGYRSHTSALAISALEGVAQTLAILPLYDLAARATPKGSEALAYSIMMSVWNLTLSLSNLFGSYLYDILHLTIMQLVWINAGSTVLVLFAIPFLPKSLMERREGEENPTKRENSKQEVTG